VASSYAKPILFSPGNNVSSLISLRSLKQIKK
jgi:hypothetical protein